MSPQDKEELERGHMAAGPLPGSCLTQATSLSRWGHQQACSLSHKHPDISTPSSKPRDTPQEEDSRRQRGGRGTVRGQLQPCAPQKPLQARPWAGLLSALLPHHYPGRCSLGAAHSGTLDNNVAAIEIRSGRQAPRNKTQETGRFPRNNSHREDQEIA